MGWQDYLMVVWHTFYRAGGAIINAQELADTHGVKLGDGLLIDFAGQQIPVHVDWEGAVPFQGARAGHSVTANGTIEITGFVE